MSSACSERVKVKTSCDCLKFHYLCNCSYSKKWIEKAWKRKTGQKKILLVIYRSTETNEENAKRYQANSILKSKNVKMPPPIYLKHKKANSIFNFVHDNVLLSFNISDNIQSNSSPTMWTMTWSEPSIQALIKHIWIPPCARHFEYWEFQHQ